MQMKQKGCNTEKAVAHTNGMRIPTMLQAAASTVDAKLICAQ